MVQGCLERFGRIDILHNNVGIAVVGGAVDLPEEEWDRVERVNQKSVFLVCKHVLPVMERQGAGAIVNTASIAGIRWTGIDYISYYATKGAVGMMTKSIALAYAAKGIRFNSILPGLMDTPMIRHGLPAAYADGDVDRMIEKRHSQCPMGHMGDAWDVARAALFLARTMRYITAHERRVDGETARCAERAVGRLGGRLGRHVGA
jgi:NAD(P)-dependent dehydrogenase (short-subunit alcohol dehydrogenase family)